MKNKIPKNLDESIEILIKGSKKKDLNKWAKTDEKDTVYGLHFSSGVSMRNN